MKQRRSTIGRGEVGGVKRVEVGGVKREEVGGVKREEVGVWRRRCGKGEVRKRRGSGRRVVEGSVRII